MKIIVQQVGDTSRSPYLVLRIAVTPAQYLLTASEKNAANDLRTFALIDADLVASRTRLVRGKELATRLRTLGV